MLESSPLPPSLEKLRSTWLDLYGAVDITFPEFVGYGMMPESDLLDREYGGRSNQIVSFKPFVEDPELISLFDRDLVPAMLSVIMRAAGASSEVALRTWLLKDCVRERLEEIDEQLGEGASAGMLKFIQCLDQCDWHERKD